MAGGEPDFRILCFAGRDEEPLLASAGRHFAACVGGALGRPWTLRLGFAEDDAMVDAADILILSLARHVRSAIPLAEIATGWSRRLAALAASDQSRVVIPTLYRHVADPTSRAGLTERIRRLNMLAVDLSRDHGAEIADVDRAFALLGAGAVGSDYRCQGETAARLAGPVIAEAMLACDLAPCLSADLHARAMAVYETLAHSTPERTRA